MLVKKILCIPERGNAVVRNYPKAKAVRNMCAFISAYDFFLAAGSAKRGEGMATMLWGGCSMILAKFAKTNHDAVKALQPRYEQIVERFGKIYLK